MVDGSKQLLTSYLFFTSEAIRPIDFFSKNCYNVAMKRIIILFLLLFAVIKIHAMDAVFVGIGPELNAASREGVALGGTLIAGVELDQNFAFGLKTGFFHNLDTVSSLKTVGFFRYTLLHWMPGPFVQTELGLAVFFEYNEAFPAFLGALAFGWRFDFDSFYLEPTVRGGYPSMWGLSVVAGRRFNIR